ncbi:MAG: hypothetical protein KA198_07250, partial [Chitinophagaceae bacterium]|nr:hypothetical protein [Chitinophagaceae bacterium]
MKLVSNISPVRILAQFLFLLLPTCLFISFILWNSQAYYSILRENWLSQSMQFSVGMICSYYVYQFRWRFIPTFLILIAGLYFTYGCLNYFSFGEFDGFFIAIKFRLFAFLFSIGWVIGWGLFRYSFFPVILSGLFVMMNMFLISKTKDIDLGKFLLLLIPVATYSVYIIFTAIRLRQLEKNNYAHWFRFIARLFLFLCLNLALFIGVVSYLWKDIEAKIEEYGGQGKEGENQMLETKKDGSVQNRQSMGLSSSNQRNKNPEPLFCAHIENYFPGTELPNPLYLASMHFTKFDTLTETFERDISIPFNDEFVPELSTLPLFMTIADSSKIRNAFSHKFRKTVEIEIYKKRLSKNTFVGPSTAFWVQP